MVTEVLETLDVHDKDTVSKEVYHLSKHTEWVISDILQQSFLRFGHFRMEAFSNLHHFTHRLHVKVQNNLVFISFLKKLRVPFHNFTKRITGKQSVANTLADGTREFSETKSIELLLINTLIVRFLL